MPNTRRESGLLMEAQNIARMTRLKDVQWVGRHLVWLEGRSDRNLLVAGSIERGWRRDLTRNGGLGAKVGYGGGDFGCATDRVFFVSERALSSQEIGSPEARVVRVFECPIASPTPSPDGRWLLLILGGEERDGLAIVPCDGGPPALVLQESDFVMQPCWHPSGQTIGWIEWDHPDMPWDSSRLVVADLDLSPTPQIRRLERIPLSDAAEEAVFQPQFSPDGRWLSCIGDGGGWANLHLFDTRSGSLTYVLESEAEYAVPAWAHGLRSYTWFNGSEKIAAVRSRSGFSQLVIWSIEEDRLDPFPAAASFTDISQPSCSRSGKNLAAIVSAPDHPPSLAVWTDERTWFPALSTPWPARPGELRPFPESPVFRPESLRFETDSGPIFGLFHSRPSDSGSAPPLLIKIHGGPTSQARAEYDPDTLFFWKLGFSVLLLNYRGSTGFGREYRSLLEGSWGETDVNDVRAAAASLRSSSVIGDIVLTGGSSGGLTALLCLARFPGFFRAAVCRYPVCDLEALTRDTHRFEKHYLDRIVGPFGAESQRYRERSPLHRADSISDPVAIFHGDKDQAVPLAQSEALVAVLRKKGTPHLFKVFPDEGHGWRRQATIQEYYQTVESFLRSHVPSLC